MPRDALIFAAACGAMVPSIVLLYLSDRQLIRTLPVQCNQLLDVNFFPTPALYYPYLECLGAVGRALHLEFYTFDLVLYPVIYATFLYGALARLWPHSGTIGILPVIAAAFDMCENACTCFILIQFPAHYPRIEMAISYFTKVKWATAFVAVLLVVLGLLRRMLCGAPKMKSG